jgi:2,3-bisphosphoglycerate-independent phosphoglycerate mutase
MKFDQKNLSAQRRGFVKAKTYFIILDGAADRPIPSLGNKTPIEVANTPNLDELAKQGEQGLLTIIDPAICPESDSGAMALLSYDPLKYYTGRGPLEGLGAGFLELSDNTVSFRINFASYNEQEQRLDRRTARDLTDDELQSLVEELKKNVVISNFDDVTFDIMAFRQHRGIFCFRSNTLPLSGNVTNTDPGFRKVGPFGIPIANYELKPLECKPIEDSPGAKNVAALVNHFVHQSRNILSNSVVNRRRMVSGKLPANILLFRDGGDPPLNLANFYEKYNRTLSFYGQIPAEQGLMRLLGGRFTYSIKNAGEDEEIYLRNTLEQIIVDESDVVFVHLKSPDEPGHDGQPFMKTQAIETIDRFFIGPLINQLKCDDLCIVTSDHATPCELRIHSADPVPVVLFGKSIKADATNAFGESYAVKGNLPIHYAADLLPYAFRQEEIIS